MDGVLVTEIDLHGDARGSFAEIFRLSDHRAPFAQLNHSHSRAGVLRGLHYHVAQTDLWYVVRGKIQVALVDLRNKDEQRPRTSSFILGDRNPTTLYIPPGVAHGYLALAESDIVYLVDREFDGSDEYGIAWDDPSLGIPWQIVDPILAERDRTNPQLQWDLIPEFS